MAPGIGEVTQPVAKDASAADSKPQSQASGSHDVKEEVCNPPVLLKYLPWNPRSDEMKRLKARLEPQEKGRPTKSAGTACLEGQK